MNFSTADQMSASVTPCLKAASLNSMQSSTLQLYPKPAAGARGKKRVRNLEFVNLIKALQTYQLDLRNKVKIGCVEGKERQLPGNRCGRDKRVGNLQIMAFGIAFDEIPGEGRDRFVNLNDLIILKGFFNASDLMQI
jgi:hypothetical protein